MIKKYVMLISAILVILMFTSTSSASFLFSKGNIYERLPENSPLKNIVDRFSQVIVSNNDNSVSIDDDEDDGEYDDGEHDDEIDPNDPKEEGLLPEILEKNVYITPDGGDEPVIDSEETTTIDSDGIAGATQEEWTVEAKPMMVKLERFVKIVTELNGNFGALLQRVIERTVATDENAISSPGSGVSAENNIVDNIVVTDGDQ